MRLRLVIAAAAMIGAGCQALDDRVAELQLSSPTAPTMQPTYNPRYEVPERFRVPPGYDPCRPIPSIDHLLDTYRALKALIPERRLSNPSIKNSHDLAESHYARAQELYHQGCGSSADYDLADLEAVFAVNGMRNAVARNNDRGSVTTIRDPELVKALR